MFGEAATQHPRWAAGAHTEPRPATDHYADKGYDWDDVREDLREADVRPVIKHRVNMAHNARHDDDIYHRRSIVEAVFVALKQRYGDTLRARTWFGQFRELVLKAAVRNVELAL